MNELTADPRVTAHFRAACAAV